MASERLKNGYCRYLDYIRTSVFNRWQNTHGNGCSCGKAMIHFKNTYLGVKVRVLLLGKVHFNYFSNL